MFCDVDTPVRRFCFRSVSVCRTTVGCDIRRATTTKVATFRLHIHPLPLICKAESSPHFVPETTRPPDCWPILSRINVLWKHPIHFCSVRYWHSSKLKLYCFVKDIETKSDKKNQQISNNKNNHSIVHYTHSSLEKAISSQIILRAFHSVESELKPIYICCVFSAVCGRRCVAI